MIDLEGLKELFLQYQKTRKQEDFADLISNLDYLIVYFIKRCRKRLGYLQGIESRDLYHDSIVALHDAVITFPSTMKAEYIPCRLRAYMLNEFRKVYRYLDKENVELDQGDYSSNRSTDVINLDKIDYDAILQSLSREEAELVDSFYTSKKQVQQLAKERNVTSPRISGKIKGIVGKFRKG